MFFAKMRVKDDLISKNGEQPMKKVMVGVFCVLSQLSAVAVDIPKPSSAKATADRSNPVLTQVSRQCIKIWCLIRNLVEYDSSAVKEQSVESDFVESLDTLLCRVMKVRDTLSHCGTNPISDTQTAGYVDSALDCIGQYTYDLKERYPGSWSDIIQEQVVRTQEAYTNHVLPLITK
jgi:hypothetical protein